MSNSPPLQSKISTPSSHSAIMADSQSGNSRPRSSLYAAIRLTRLVLNVTARLKSRIKSKKQPGNFQAQAFEEISRGLNSQPSSGSIARTRYMRKKTEQQEQEFSKLLYDLDSHTQSSSDSIRTIAAHDEKFLKYDAEQTARTCSTATLSQILGSTKLVLDYLQLQGRQSSTNRKNSIEVCDKLKCEKFLANLEHLIRCLRHAVIEALLQEALRLLEIQFWGQYLQQQREIEGCFAEWPNSQPPLNTTWPWNVKPSLVVLWGVCWMFYNDNVNISWTTDRENPSRVADKPGTSQPYCRVGSNNLIPLDGAYFDQALNSESWLPELSSGDRVPASDSQRDAKSQDQTRAYNNPELYSNYQYIHSSTSNFFTTQPTYNSSGWNIFHEWEPQYSTSNNNGQPLNLTITPQTQEPQGVAQQPYDHRLQLQETSVPNAIAHGRLGSLVMPAQTNESSAQEPSPCLSRSSLSPSAPAYPASTSSIGSPNTNHKVRMEAARMEDGFLHCVHADCVNKPRVFSRRCEYTKHMDKHTRPYVCEEIGCEKIQGFTYSGGLHRHQREVHHQHGGPKASCLCPHRDCKRSLIGRGFTRKENLVEHLRRVHRGDVDEPAVPSHPLGPMIGEVFSSTSPNAQISRKRKKVALDGVEADSNDNGDAGDEPGDDLNLEVKRLRKELKLKDERVRYLESVIEKLSRLAKEQMLVTNAV